MSADRVEVDLPATVEWRGGELYLLDQTLLPLEVLVELQEKWPPLFPRHRIPQFEEPKCSPRS